MKIMSYAIAAGLAVASLATTASAADITGAGATFPFPIYAKWAEAYNKETGNRPELSVDRLQRRHPPDPGQDRRFRRDRCAPEGRGASRRTASSSSRPSWAAWSPVYNIQGVAAGQLKLTGEVLADIFNGKITKWNDAKIAQVNQGVTLPNAAITPVYRSDGSGTTSVFTTYLSQVSESWKSGPGAGASVQWPVGQGGKGNEGVAALVKQVPNSIGYVEYAYAKQNSIPFAQLQNKNGKFVGARGQDLPGRRRQRRLEVGSRLRHLADEPARRRGLADHGADLHPGSQEPGEAGAGGRGPEVLRLVLQERRQDGGRTRLRSAARPR